MRIGPQLKYLREHGRYDDQHRGWDIRCYSRLRSTTAQAVALLERGDLALPAVVWTTGHITDQGPGDKVWYSDENCLRATFAYPASADRPGHQLTWVALRGVRHLAATYVGFFRANRPGICCSYGLQFRWPNDLLYNGKKVARVVCLRVHGADVMGVEINVNGVPRTAPPEVQAQAGSLRAYRQHRYPLEEALDKLEGCLFISRLAWRCDSPATFFRRINRPHVLNGWMVTVDTGRGRIVGRCERIDTKGRLVLRNGNRAHRLVSGAVVAATPLN